MRNKEVVKWGTLAEEGRCKGSSSTGMRPLCSWCLTEVVSTGGSISNMYGMVLARYRRNPNLKRMGIFGQKPLVVFTSDQVSLCYVYVIYGLKDHVLDS